MRSLVTMLIGSLLVAGCGGFYMPADKLRPRAAYDLQCDQNQLQMQELSGDCGKKLAEQYSCTIGVRGCGKQATYVHLPNADWVMNNTATPAAPPK